MSDHRKPSVGCGYSIRAMEANSLDDSVLSAKKIDANLYSEMLKSAQTSLAEKKLFIDSTLNSVNQALAETEAERYYSGGKAVQNRNNLSAILEDIEEAETVLKNLSASGIEAKVAEYNGKLPKLKRAAILKKLIEQADQINAARKYVTYHDNEITNPRSTKSFTTYERFIYISIHSFTIKRYEPATGEPIWNEHIMTYEHINYDDCRKDVLSVTDGDIAKLEMRITALGYSVNFDKSKVVYD